MKRHCNIQRRPFWWTSELHYSTKYAIPWNIRFLDALRYQVSSVNTTLISKALFNLGTSMNYLPYIHCLKSSRFREFQAYTSHSSISTLISWASEGSNRGYTCVDWQFLFLYWFYDYLYYTCYILTLIWRFWLYLDNRFLATAMLWSITEMVLSSYHLEKWF